MNFEDGRLAPMSALSSGALVPGSRVFVSDAAGRVRVFAVQSRQLYGRQELTQHPELFSPAGPRRLVLITCGGAVVDGWFSQNVVVIAVPVT